MERLIYQVGCQPIDFAASMYYLNIQEGKVNAQTNRTKEKCHQQYADRHRGSEGTEEGRLEPPNACPISWFQLYILALSRKRKSELVRITRQKIQRCARETI